MKFLFVCRANIGRSQMGEHLMRLYYPHTKSDSAGTHVIDDFGFPAEGQKIVDIPRSIHIRDAMDELGSSLSHATRTQLHPDMVQKYDAIFMMAEPETIPAYIHEADNVYMWPIPDPKGHTLEGTRLIRDHILMRIHDFMRS